MSALGRALKNQISEARIQAGRKRIPKRVIVDAQSVKKHGYCQGKGLRYRQENVRNQTTYRC